MTQPQVSNCQNLQVLSERQLNTLNQTCGIEILRKQHAVSTLIAILRTQRDAREDELPLFY